MCVYVYIHIYSIRHTEKCLNFLFARIQNEIKVYPFAVQPLKAIHLGDTLVDFSPVFFRLLWNFLFYPSDLYIIDVLKLSDVSDEIEVLFDVVINLLLKTSLKIKCRNFPRSNLNIRVIFFICLVFVCFVFHKKKCEGR